MKLWSVRVYGLDGNPFDPVIEAPSAAAARYGTFKAAREAGYFAGRDGFRRFLTDVLSVRPATETEAALAPRLPGGGR